jgi:hypothetical protein
MHRVKRLDSRLCNISEKYLCGVADPIVLMSKVYITYNSQLRYFLMKNIRKQTNYVFQMFCLEC